MCPSAPGLAGKLERNGRDSYIPSVVIPVDASLRRYASQSQRSSSAVDMPSRRLRSARCRIGQPSRVPPGEAARPDPQGGGPPRAAGAAAVPQLLRVTPPARRCRDGPRAAGEHRRGKRVQAGGAGKSGVDRLQPLGGLEQQRRSVAPRLEANASWARTRPTRACCNSSSGPASAMPSSASAAPNAPTWTCTARGQRPPGPLRRVERQRRRTLEERRRGGQPPAGLRPGGRALQLPGDILIGSRCRLGPVPGAAIRSACGSVTSASARCTSCRSCSDVDQ